MMLSSVDFPDPDGPTIGDPFALPHRQVDVDERVDRRLGAVFLAQILEPDDRGRRHHQRQPPGAPVDSVVSTVAVDPPLAGEVSLGVTVAAAGVVACDVAFRWSKPITTRSPA